MLDFCFNPCDSDSHGPNMFWSCDLKKAENEKNSLEKQKTVSKTKTHPYYPITASVNCQSVCQFSVVAAPSLHAAFLKVTF